MDRLITYSEYEEVEKVLKYLRNTLNIKPSRIEKCPSILYFGCENIIDNYNFLESNGFNVLKLNDCLHILNCNNELLEETYEYVVKKYGEKLLLKNPSILSVPVLVIRRVEDVSQGRLSKKGILSVAAYINYENEINLSTNELREILDICEVNGLDVKDGSSVFRRKPKEVREIIELCNLYGIRLDGGTIFRCKPENIKPIVDVCSELGIDYSKGGNLFRKKAKDILDIANTCMSLGIDYKKSGTIFERSAEEIESIAGLCEEKGITYKSGGTVFSKPFKVVKEIISVCEKNDIDCTGGGTLFLRTAEEIEEIVSICKEYGIEYKSGGSAFSKKPKYLREVAKICKENNLEATGVILTINPERIKANIEFIKENYDQRFIDRMILTQSTERLKEVFPYLEETENLGALLNGSSAILSLTLDEIKFREEVLRREGEEILVDGKFHPIFGQSKKKFEKFHGVTAEAIRNEQNKKETKS